MTTSIKTTRSTVFTNAWKLVKSTGVTISEALKAAWSKIKNNMKNAVKIDLQFLNEKHDSVCIVLTENVNCKVRTFRSEKSMPAYMYKGDGNSDNFSGSTHFANENFSLANILKSLNSSYDAILNNKCFEFSENSKHFVAYEGNVSCTSNFFNSQF